MIYDRNLKVNFFPLHFIISFITFLVLVTVFRNTVYTYMSSNIYLNGLIIVLFVVAMVWIFGVLAYYRKSAKVLSMLLSYSAKGATTTKGKGDKKTYKESNMGQRKVSEIASAISGTLIDSPAISKALALSTRNGVVELTSYDSSTILEYVEDNGNRVLGLSKFLTSLFTMLGLLGTFLGLLQAIDGVGKALAALSNIPVSYTHLDVYKRQVKLLADPLQGMSVAFSTSLFGLVAALFGNYGNFVASTSLSTFSFKLKNVLSANVGIASIDHNRIEAKDILLALDDSFNKLYMGLSDRLDVLSDSIISMVKGIARTNERQEKVFEVVLDNFESLEVAINNIATVVDLPDEIRKISEDNADEMKNYWSTSILPVLEDIAYDSNMSAKASDVIASNTTDVSAVVSDMADVVDGMSEQLVTTSDDMLRAVDTFSDLSEDLREDMAGLRGTFEGFASNTTDIIQSFDDTINKVADAGIMLENLDRTIYDLSNTVADNTNALTDSTAQSLDSVNSVYTLIDRVDALNDDLKVQVTGLADEIGGLADDVKDGVADLTDEVKNSITGLTNEVQDSVKDLTDSMKDSIDDVVAEVSALNKDFVSQVDGLVVEIGGLADDVKDSVKVLGDDVKDSIAGLTDEVQSSVTALTNEVQDSVKDLTDEVRTSVDGLIAEVGSLNDGVNSRIDSLVEGISNSFVGVEESINNLIAQGQDAVDVVVEKMTALQEDVIAGNSQLASDTLANLENLQATLNEMVDSFTNSLNEVYAIDRMDNILNLVSNINDVSTNAYNSMVETLGALQSQSLDANDRLDVIATVVDALITEILNSRDVTQSILDVVASGNDLAKVEE